MARSVVVDLCAAHSKDVFHKFGLRNALSFFGGPLQLKSLSRHGIVVCVDVIMEMAHALSDLWVARGTRTVTWKRSTMKQRKNNMTSEKNLTFFIVEIHDIGITSDMPISDEAAMGAADRWGAQ